MADKCGTRLSRMTVWSSAFLWEASGARETGRWCRRNSPASSKILTRFFLEGDQRNSGYVPRFKCVCQKLIYKLPQNIFFIQLSTITVDFDFYDSWTGIHFTAHVKYLGHLVSFSGIFDPTAGWLVTLFSAFLCHRFQLLEFSIKDAYDIL